MIVPPKVKAVSQRRKKSLESPFLKQRNKRPGKERGGKGIGWTDGRPPATLGARAAELPAGRAQADKSDLQWGVAEEELAVTMRQWTSNKKKKKRERRGILLGGGCHSEVREQQQCAQRGRSSEQRTSLGGNLADGLGTSMWEVPPKCHPLTLQRFGPFGGVPAGRLGPGAATPGADALGRQKRG